jgi:hypothetical protein
MILGSIIPWIPKWFAAPGTPVPVPFPVPGGDTTGAKALLFVAAGGAIAFLAHRLLGRVTGRRGLPSQSPQDVVDSSAAMSTGGDLHDPH